MAPRKTNKAAVSESVVPEKTGEKKRGVDCVTRTGRTPIAKLGKTPAKVLSKKEQNKLIAGPNYWCDEYEKFSVEFESHGNATRAYMMAFGIDDRTKAGYLGCILNKNPNIQKHVNELRAERTERRKDTEERVLRELEKIAYLDPRAFYTPDGVNVDLNQLDPDTAAAITALSFREGHDHRMKLEKIKITDKIRALELLGKHAGMYREPLPTPYQYGEVVTPDEKARTSREKLLASLKDDTDEQ